MATRAFEFIRRPVRRILKSRSERKLVRGIKVLDTAPTSLLDNVEWLEGTIRSIGLKYLPPPYEECYGLDARYMNFHGDGLFQIPRQFAKFLSLVAMHRPTTFIEIGTNNGWSACVAAAYLRRFNPDFELTTIDIVDHFSAWPRVARLLPLKFVVGKTSDDYAGKAFDTCFIDGDHSLAWVDRDFRNVGQHARVCAFHDINDSLTDINDGAGSRTHWNALKASLSDSSTLTEILDHTQSRSVMGIGIFTRRD